MPVGRKGPQDQWTESSGHQIVDGVLVQCPPESQSLGVRMEIQGLDFASAVRWRQEGARARLRRCVTRDGAVHMDNPEAVRAGDHWR
ncbi:hypothetical protein ASC76_19400 [Rhizobacter sp. Root404]|nr:hypothetical protein ASC76_19400 [Rhizobacter sp. Root404]